MTMLCFPVNDSLFTAIRVYIKCDDKTKFKKNENTLISLKIG